MLLRTLPVQGFAGGSPSPGAESFARSGLRQPQLAQFMRRAPAPAARRAPWRRWRGRAPAPAAAPGRKPARCAATARGPRSTRPGARRVRGPARSPRGQRSRGRGGIRRGVPLFRVELLRQLHRALHVGEENRHLLPLALEGAPRREGLFGEVPRGVGSRGRGTAVRRPAGESLPALATELRGRRVTRAARRTRELQLGPARAAEKRVGEILGLAAWTALSALISIYRNSPATLATCPTARCSLDFAPSASSRRTQPCVIGIRSSS